MMLTAVFWGVFWSGLSLGLAVMGLGLWSLLVFNVGVWGTFVVCMWRDCHDGPWWFEEWFGQR